MANHYEDEIRAPVRTVDFSYGKGRNGGFNGPLTQYRPTIVWKPIEEDNSKHKISNAIRSYTSGKSNL